MTDSTIDLADIPGLGPVRRAALAEAGVRDLQSLLGMKVEELAQIRGIGQWQAERIREYLRQRGFVLVPAEDETGAPGVLVSPAPSPEEAAALARGLRAIEETAQEEQRLESEVALIERALEERKSERVSAGGAPPAAPSGEPETSAPAPPAEGSAVPPESTAGEETLDAEAAGEEAVEPAVPGETAPVEDEAATLRERVAAQREAMPEAALSLMEAIRRAAVSQQLTRQLTRFLIVASEFTSEERLLPARAYEKASAALAGVDRAIQRAIRDEAFRPSDQKALAKRIRVRRKELERLIDGEPTRADRE